jgi:hypothetical protein
MHQMCGANRGVHGGRGCRSYTVSGRALGPDSCQSTPHCPRWNCLYPQLAKEIARTTRLQRGRSRNSRISRRARSEMFRYRVTVGWS